MGDKTGIAWCDATWNPVVGCDQVSPGCAHCYAKTLHDRRHKAYWAEKNVPDQYAMPFEYVQIFYERLDLPLKWRRPRRIFVNSVSDLFHDAVPDSFIDEVWATMLLAPQHIFQILTKRPERMRDYVSDTGLYKRVLWAAGKLRSRRPALIGIGISDPTKFPANWIWLGTSVENQHWADIRVPLLLQTPAAVRFLSCEPLLGPLDLGRWQQCNCPHDYQWPSNGHNIYCPKSDKYVGQRLDWLIAGGESGPGFRPMDPDWARTLRDQCVKHDVAFFYKQPSGLRPESNPYLDGLQWHQFPGDLAVPVAKGA